jgi:hypothetical protein
LASVGVKRPRVSTDRRRRGGYTEYGDARSTSLRLSPEQVTGLESLGVTLIHVTDNLYFATSEYRRIS